MSMTRRTSPQRHFGFGDRWLWLVTIVISLFGVLMVYDASVAIGIREFGNQYHFVSDQIRWLILGFTACAVCASLDYHRWNSIALPVFISVLCLLVLVFVPGIGVKALGAHRWINFHFFVIQPAELAKFAIVIYLSAWFSVTEKGRFIAFLLLLGMVFGLIIIEPDLGTGAIILGISFLLYFFSGAPIRHFIFLVPCLFAVLIFLAVISPYRMQRLTSFLNPSHDPLGTSYQIRQVLLSLGSGGIFGLGIGQSRQKYEYLPEANTDAIFAIIGEEMGFVGAVGLIVLYLFLLWRGFSIASRAPDRFGKLLAAGMTGWIGLQVCLNLSAMVALLPLTGIPLPLISYGGSSLVTVLAGIGIIQSVSRQQKIS